MIHLDISRPKARIASEVMLPMIHSRSADFGKIALSSESKTKIESRCKALHRPTENFEIGSAAVSKFLSGLFPGRKKRSAPAVGRTNWKFGDRSINIFMLSLSHGKLAFPTAGTMLENNGGASSSDAGLDLIQRSVDLFGSKRIDCAVGAGEFASKEFIGQPVSKETDSGLRVDSNTQVEKKNGDRTDARNISGI